MGKTRKPVQTAFIETDTSPDGELAMAEVLDAWNALAKTAGLPVARDLGKTRRTHLGARLKDKQWRDTWQEALALIPTSDCLSGRIPGRNWRCTLDFFLKPDTVGKILEGDWGVAARQHWSKGLNLIDKARNGRPGPIDNSMTGREMLTRLAIGEVKRRAQATNRWSLPTYWADGPTLDAMAVQIERQFDTIGVFEFYRLACAFFTTPECPWPDLEKSVPNMLRHLGRVQDWVTTHEREKRGGVA